ncbi:enoyl-CoA hydratase/isomerase family protein [Solirubrobacter sp. CPCC 204708]|uniref:Enoyl-CoA hydratase/isomerase family protein n=1 Tax=Solirubrobacter deserti TaxID=2282478 RepID=A0ABT4RD37_9ACTN|nr:enoyl-CoA hydratase/isomerase family protein [Solirubrobacter deserti]MBE2317771.1 enoyl-CoA hydratase/isomerase family protein [Solirubrobacter deserti]MDA0136452.1 enoyl-CoA hydratase/isomerase family protein [Solirubrobacter deserti]
MEARRLYLELTDGLTRPLRAEELVYAVPGLPAREDVAAEREKPQKDKAGLEIAQGAFLADVLAEPDTGRHLIETMLAPTPLALEHAEAFARDGHVDLGRAHAQRHGNVGIVELRNPRHLNAEDDTTLGPLEAGIDLLLLDEATEICVLRGGVVDHPRYAGRRIFGAGLNLTHLYRGQISYLFFPVRDLGLVHKVFRADKLWIAAAETFAIGGGCQLLLTVDHILCERGTRLTLPARNEGIIPGAANLRLPRFVGDRRARQAILSGSELTPEELADELVEPGEMDAAIERRAAALSSAGAVSGVANRKAFRVGQEPLDVFREYMSVYCREQAVCSFSPALIRNLEEHWRAHERGD